MTSASLVHAEVDGSNQGIDVCQRIMLVQVLVWIEPLCKRSIQRLEKYSLVVN